MVRERLFTRVEYQLREDATSSAGQRDHRKGVLPAEEHPHRCLQLLRSNIDSQVFALRHPLQLRDEPDAVDVRGE